MDAKTSPLFGASYHDYWKERVTIPGDGSKVPGDSVCEHYVRQLAIQPCHRVLDLGCGFGRLFPMLSRHTSQVIGIDISSEMIADAAHFPYTCLIKASAENTRLPGAFVDRVITWATFDVVNQELGLKEANRILKSGGMVLLTGKNVRYRIDDSIAFIAERNAKLKAFPNHFTNVQALSSLSAFYGFQIESAHGFECRGDLGENRALDLTTDPVPEFYEFVLILRKTGNPSDTSPVFSYEFSDTAALLAAKHNFGGPLPDFFKWHRATFGD